MIHKKLNDGNGYGVSRSSVAGLVLLQLMDGKDGEQVRVVLTVEEALLITAELCDAVRDTLTPKTTTNQDQV